jgi:hypothetical protein
MYYLRYLRAGVDDLNANGWRYTFKEVPSPADIEYALGGKRDLWNSKD